MRGPQRGPFIALIMELTGRQMNPARGYGRSQPPTSRAYTPAEGQALSRIKWLHEPGGALVWGAGRGGLWRPVPWAGSFVRANLGLAFAEMEVLSGIRCHVM